jgi:hypothetical protein
MDHKMDQVSIKYTSIFHCKTLQNLPKFVFLVWKQTIWQPCILLADERARNGVLQTMIRRFNVEELHIRYIHQIYKYFAKIFLSWRFCFLDKKMFLLSFSQHFLVKIWQKNRVLHLFCEWIFFWILNPVLSYISDILFCLEILVLYLKKHRQFLGQNVITNIHM